MRWTYFCLLAPYYTSSLLIDSVNPMDGEQVPRTAGLLLGVLRWVEDVSVQAREC